MTDPFPRQLGAVFDEVPDLYDRVRPAYPDALYADLIELTGLDASSNVLEVGCGTGQATTALAVLAGSVTAVEPGAGMVDLARRRLAARPNVTVEHARFEDWDDRGRRFDLVVAASSWHWIDPAVGWRRAHDVLTAGGWLASLGHVVIRVPGEIEVYAATADLHERYSPGNPGWSDPPLADEVQSDRRGWGPPNEDVEGLFEVPVARWYPTVQWFDGAGFADLLRSTSLYRRLEPGVREPLLDAIAERIRTHLDDRVPRHYLSVLRAGRRIG